MIGARREVWAGGGVLIKAPTTGRTDARKWRSAFLRYNWRVEILAANANVPNQLLNAYAHANAQKVMHCFG